MSIPWDSILTVATSIFASTGFWTWIVSRNSYKKKDHESILLLKEANLATLHDRLYYLCGKTLERQSITLEEYENLNVLYQSYKALGGNGTIHRMMDEIEKMDLIKS